MLDYSDFLNTLAEISDLQYNRPLTERGIGMWTMLLASESVQPQDALAALLAHIKDSERGKFAPKPADIFHQLKEKTKPTMTGEQAFGLYLDTMRRHGTYQSVMFECPRTQAAARVLGWADAGALPLDSLKMRIRDFVKVYEDCDPSITNMKPIDGHHRHEVLFVGKDISIKKLSPSEASKMLTGGKTERRSDYKQLIEVKRI